MITYGDIPRNYNLASDFLDRNLESGRAENVALYFDDRKITYAELAALSNRIGHVLLDLGVGIEDRVLLALNDCPEFVAAWYATLKIGAVVAEVYTFLQPQDYAYYLNYTRAKSVIVDSTTLPKVREVEPACRHLDHILVVGTAELLGRKEISLAPALVQAPAELKPENTTKDDIALWKFTTGSTGKPKAAVHCHHDPRISFESYAKGVLQMTAEDRVLAVPKLFFGYARDLVSLFAFGVGAAGIIFSERSTPGRIFELIERHRPTLLVNVPTMMNQMVSYPDAASKDLSCLRLKISSGEALPPDLHRDWLRLFGV